MLLRACSTQGRRAQARRPYFAIYHDWTDAKGEKKEETEWTPITVLNPRAAKWIVENIRKGDTVHVEARVRQNSYEKNGEKFYVIVDAVDLVSRKFDRLHVPQRVQHSGPAGTSPSPILCNLSLE